MSFSNCLLPLYIFFALAAGGFIANLGFETIFFSDGYSRNYYLTSRCPSISSLIRSSTFELVGCFFELNPPNYKN
jgi:hypothetical protein